MFAACLAAILFALSAILGRHASRLLGVVAANCARLWVAAAILACWAHGFGPGLGGKGLPIYMLSGVVGFGVGDMGLFAALPRIGSRLSMLMLHCLAAPLAAVIEWLWLGVRPGGLDLACGAVILLGVAIAIAPERGVTVPVEPLAASRRRSGVWYGLMAAVGQAAGAVISRKAFIVTHAAGQAIDGGTAAYQRALGGLIVVTAALLFTKRRAASNLAPEKPTMRSAWPFVVGNALLGATIGVSCYQWALATTPSAVVLPIVALTPLFAVPFAYLFEGERPSPRSLVGGALAVAAAVALATLRKA